jgi:hypothetical protein
MNAPDDNAAMPHPPDLTALPGGERVAEGLADLAANRRTESALWLSMAATRLGELGLPLPNPIPNAEMGLYHHLAGIYGDNAHSQFNALRRLLVSFQRAWACAS